MDRHTVLPVASAGYGAQDIELEALPLRGVYVLTRLSDRHASPDTALLHRIGMEGHFTHGISLVSHHQGHVRGLHCQIEPAPQGRLMQCEHGVVWCVVVDVRTGSPTFGQWVAETLSAENGRWLWIPPGFLHGSCTLGDRTAVRYHCTTPPQREYERAVRWNDEALGIGWPVADTQAVLSRQDLSAAPFFSVIDWFAYA
ncbi:dTDP-4-dehydrorhamnose 3,5-epimerase family protein [Komagataeibacter diospyri]|nr:dTDP-4-dehydrorhamnose 3,5-epimerase family protein [Komagataeibacter diospyri]